MRPCLSNKNNKPIYLISRKPVVIAAMILCALFLLSLFSSVNAETYLFKNKWGNSGTDNGQFHYVWGIAVDSSGKVYVADTDNHRIQKFTVNGEFLTKWGTYGTGNGQFDYPWDVAVDASGNVYVVDNQYNIASRVQKFDSSGNFLLAWSGNLNNPRGIAVDSSSNVYVADHGNHRVKKFDSSGNLLLTLGGTSGAGNGQFSGPNDVVVDSSGNIYVTDYFNRRVQKFDNQGVFLTKWGSQGNQNGNFQEPYGIAVDNAGNLYVGDRGRSDIQKFTSAGVYLGKWYCGSPYVEANRLVSPASIAIDYADNIYVVDQNNWRIQKFAIQPPSSMYASNSEGLDKEVFLPNEAIYATVPASGQTVSFYTTLHKPAWAIGDQLTEVFGGKETIWLNSAGTQTVQVWASPLNPGYYDLVMDTNNNGVYDQGDLVDQGNVTGLMVVPEYLYGGLLAMFGCFLAFAVYYKRRGKSW
jgi:DNA-binding beta-propeller fold protein YncE